MIALVILKRSCFAGLTALICVSNFTINNMLKHCQIIIITLSNLITLKFRFIISQHSIHEFIVAYKTLEHYEIYGFTHYLIRELIRKYKTGLIQNYLCSNGSDTV